MKKLLIVICVLFIFVVSVSTAVLYSKNANNYKIQTQSIYGYNKLSSEESKDDLYENLFITVIYPHVEKAIYDYYDEYMTYIPGEDPWSYKFISIEKMSGLNYSYIVKLQVQPYVGPHLSVGIDHITLNINLDNVKIEKFDHIKSYQLPPHYQGIIKKNLP